MRSYLFVPGDDARKIAKALGSAADAVILDLEDSVAPANRDKARAEVARTLSALSPEERGKLPALFVRINALDTGLADADLAAVVPHAPAGIVQPKCEHADDVKRLCALIGGHETPACRNATAIIAIATETARSLFHLGSYADAGPRLCGLAWGAEDLSADLGAHTSKDEEGRHTAPYELARTLCLAGAVAAGVQPIDGIHGDFRDEEGLRREARRALRDGFVAKIAIHPAQIAIINEAFTPSAADLAHAQRIVDAFAGGANAGVIALDGKMFDRPHLTRAEKLLARAARRRGA